MIKLLSLSISSNIDKFEEQIRLPPDLFYFSRAVDTWIFCVLLSLIPTTLYVVNPIWMNNPPGDWDVWMYYGYIRHLFQYYHDGIWPANAYIGTRLAYYLPAHLFYLAAGDQGYRIWFNLLFCCPIIILSFFYVMRSNLDLRVATASSVILATDLYFLRSMGWDYVDKGVLTYEMAVLACLTAATGSRRRCCLMTVVAGFFGASMMFVHLASAIVFPVVFAYSGFVVHNCRSLRSWLNHFLRVVICGSIGAVVAQILFGSLLYFAGGGEFFFILKQIMVVKSNITGWNANLSTLIREGRWIVVPLAALVASAAIVATKRYRVSFTDFEAFCLWSVVALYTFIFAGEVTGRLWLLSRDGMHSTVLTPFSMMTYGILLFRRPFRGMVVATLVAFAASFIVRTCIADGAGLSKYMTMSVPTLGVVIGCVLAINFAVARASMTIVSLALVAFLGAFNWVKFSNDHVERGTHDRIYSFSKQRIPRILFSQNDRSLSFIWGVLASFTDRALYVSRNTFPAYNVELMAGDVVAIMKSDLSETDRADIAAISARYKLAQIDQFDINDVTVETFEVQAAENAQ